MKRFRITFFLSTLLFALSLQAQTAVGEAQAKQMLQQISKAAQNTKSIDCQFVQKKTMSFLNETMTSKGRLCFQSPSRLRWEYTTPTPYVFVINGGVVRIQSKSGSNTIDLRANKRFQGIAQMMMNSVTGKNLAANGDFKTKMLTNGDEWIAELTPLRKDVKQMFSLIRLHFSQKQQMMTRVEMVEKNGDRTDIVLQNVKNEHENR